MADTRGRNARGRDEEHSTRRNSSSRNTRSNAHAHSSHSKGRTAHTPEEKRRMAKRHKKAKRKKRMIGILVLEVFLILILGVGVWGLGKLDKLQSENIGDVVVNEDMDEDTAKLLKGYTNVALFGIDTRKIGELGAGNRSDTMIIASINNETKEVKLMSVYRDTYLNRADDTYGKCNAAYKNGGPKQAMEMLDEYPDIVIGCAGGGSNLGGLISPFMQDKLLGKADPRIIAVEPASCPSLTRGKYVYDFCDTGHVTPLARMYTLGNGFMPAPNHAGGLRYHGMSPILSKLYHDGYMEAVSVKQTGVFDAAVQFAKVETILPAPESSHAIRAAIDEALKCKETGEAKTILFGLTGTGYFDMAAYEAYHNGTMRNHIPTDEELQIGFDTIPPQE